MNSVLYKQGLYEKLEITQDIPVPKYKAYEYNVKNFIDISYKDKIPLFFIENTYKQIKLIDNYLFIDNLKIDISLLKIKDVLQKLEQENIKALPLTDSQSFLTLPAIFMSLVVSI